MSACFAVRFNVAAAQWPALEAGLEQLGALAVTQSGGDAALFDEPGVARGDRWSRFDIEALFDSALGTDAVLDLVRELVGADIANTATAVADEAWAESWKAHWQPLSFGGGLCVCPSWCEAPADARHVLRIDPGQAFGTGTHETTALCLDWLAAAGLEGHSVIDYGCGSGVLALAAAALGAAPVFAVDIDAAAIETASANVRHNHAAATVSVGPAELVAGQVADVLVANILMEPLLALAPRFAALVRPRGRMALAGLLADQAAAVCAAYAGAFALGVVEQRGEWVLLAGSRQA